MSRAQLEANFEACKQALLTAIDDSRTAMAADWILDQCEEWTAEENARHAAECAAP